MQIGYFIKKRIKGENSKLLLLSLFITTLALIFIRFSIMIPLVLKHGRELINQDLDYEIENYGICINSMDDVMNKSIDELNDYMKCILDSEEIESIGTWQYSILPELNVVGSDYDYWKDMINIASSNIQTFNDEKIGVQYIGMRLEAFRLSRIKCLEGGLDISQKIDNCSYILLGYNYKDIPVGTVFEIKSGQGEGYRYKVAGVIEKDEGIINTTAIFSNLGGIQFMYDIPINNMVVLLYEGENIYSSFNNLFLVSDGFSYEDAERKIKEISDIKGIPVSVQGLRDRVDYIMSDADSIVTIIYKITILLLSTSSIILITSQILMMTMRKNELGIWISNGISKKWVLTIVFFETLLKMLCSNLLAGILSFALIRSRGFSEAVIYQYRNVLFCIPGLVSLAVCLIVSVGIVFIPKYYLKNKSVSQLILGCWE